MRFSVQAGIGGFSLAGRAGGGVQFRRLLCIVWLAILCANSITVCVCVALVPCSIRIQSVLYGYRRV